MSTAADILSELSRSVYYTDKTKKSGGFIFGLVCPECNQPEAFVYENTPFAIICNHVNKCHSHTSVFKLFPELLTSVEEKFPPTPENPNLPAEEYLKRRGLSQSLAGLIYKYQPQIRNGRGGILFPVGINSKGKDVVNGRIFNPAKGDQKGAGYGEQEGLFWRHPGITYDPTVETFVVEGIINALALIEMEFQAIAILSSGRKPENIDLSEFKKLTFAFDYDKAGWSASKAWIKKHPEAHVIAYQKHGIKHDWDDILLGSNAEKAREYFFTNRRKMEMYGKLALSDSAKEYGEIYFEYTDRAPGLFEYNKCYYYSEEKNELKKGVKIPYVTTHNVSTFTLDVQHYELDKSDPNLPNYQFFIKINPKDKAPISCLVRASELATPGQLSQLFLQRAMSVWSGTGNAVTALLKKITSAKAPVVRKLNRIGLDFDSNCYVFHNYIIDPAGKMIFPNEHGIFEYSLKNYLKPERFKDDYEGLQDDDISLTEPPPADYKKHLRDIILKMGQAWGYNAYVAIAWMVGSWFLTDIKKQTKFFPFLSVSGQPGTGKTNFIKYLNQMQGFNSEGLPLTRKNTDIGIARYVSRRNCLFTALLEDKKGREQQQQTRFDYSSILTLYNNYLLQVKGKRSNDNQTETLFFYGSWMFVQNVEPFSERAEHERVISLYFDKDEDDMQLTKIPFDQLSRIPPQHFAWMYPAIMRDHVKFKEKWYEKYLQAKNDLAKIVDFRINENYALMLSMWLMICDIFDIDETKSMTYFIRYLGQQKEAFCKQDHSVITDNFFDILFNLNKHLPEKDKEEFSLCYNERPDKNEIRVNLNGVLKMFADQKYQFHTNIREITDHLKNHSAFKMYKNCRFKTNGVVADSKSGKAFVFDLQKLKHPYEETDEDDFPN